MMEEMIRIFDNCLEVMFVIKQVLWSLGEGILGFFAGKAGEKITDKLVEESLSRADDSIRDNLRSKVSEYDYDYIDRFLSESSIYARSQTSRHYTIPRKITQQIITDFYDKYPNLKHHSARISPMLRKVVQGIYIAIIEQLDVQHRILYKQNDRNTQDVLDAIHTLEKKQSNHTRLTNYETKMYYSFLQDSFDKGSFEIIEKMIKILCSLVEPADLFYITAFRIHLDYYLRGAGNAANECAAFISLKPTQVVLIDVIVFLVQVEDYQSLKILKDHLLDFDLKRLIEVALTNDNTQISDLLIKDNLVVDTYKKYKATYWILGNFSLHAGILNTARLMYNHLDGQKRTNFTHWRLLCIEAKERFQSFIITDDKLEWITLLKTTLLNMQKIVDNYLKCHENIVLAFIEPILSYGYILSDDDFSAILKALPTPIQNLNKVREYCFMNKLFNNWQSINDCELYTFCSQNNCKGLWSQYLLHQVDVNPQYVIDFNDTHLEEAEKDYKIAVAYFLAIKDLRGIDVAFSYAKDYVPSAEYKSSHAVFLAMLTYDSKHPDSQNYLNSAVTIIIEGNEVDLQDLVNLSNILVQHGYWQRAVDLYDHFKDQNREIKRKELSLLMIYNSEDKKCKQLLDELLSENSEDAELLLYKGILQEQALLGAGCASFEKSFRAKPTSRAAWSTLMSRYHLHKYLTDDVLTYCEHHDDYRLQHISGMIYNQIGDFNKASLCFLKALLRLTINYDEGLFAAFYQNNLHDKKQDKLPKCIDINTAVILKTTDNDSVLKLCIHGEPDTIPSSGTEFAGFTHIFALSPLALRLRFCKQNSIVNIGEKTYRIVSINHRGTEIAHYCMDQLLAHGDMQAIHVSDDISSLFEQMRDLTKEHDKTSRQIFEVYKKLDPGTTLYIVTRAFGKPYCETVRSLYLDREVPFWAGSDGCVIDKTCILSLSTIIVMAELGLSPFDFSKSDVHFCVGPMTRRTIETERTHYYQDNSSGTLGFDESGHPFFNQLTPEGRRRVNEFFARMLDICDSATVCEEIDAEQYCDELKRIVDAMGPFDIEAIALAQKNDYLVISEDLMLRRYMSHIGIKSASASGLIAQINLDPIRLIKIINSLADN